MKGFQEFLIETSGFSKAELVVLNKSKIDFDTSIDELALGRYKDFGIIINKFRNGMFEATISRGDSEDHIATISDKTLKILINKVDKKLK